MYVFKPQKDDSSKFWLYLTTLGASSNESPDAYVGLLSSESVMFGSHVTSRLLLNVKEMILLVHSERSTPLKQACLRSSNILFFPLRALAGLCSDVMHVLTVAPEIRQTLSWSITTDIADSSPQPVPPSFSSVLQWKLSSLLSSYLGLSDEANCHVTLRLPSKLH